MRLNEDYHHQTVSLFELVLMLVKSLKDQSSSQPRLSIITSTVNHTHAVYVPRIIIPRQDKTINHIRLQAYFQACRSARTVSTKWQQCMRPYANPVLSDCLRQARTEWRLKHQDCLIFLSQQVGIGGMFCLEKIKFMTKSSKPWICLGEHLAIVNNFHLHEKSREQPDAIQTI